MLGAFTPRKPCCSYGCVHWVIIESAFLTLGHGQKLRKPWLSRWLSKLQFPAVLTIYLCKTFLLLEARLDPAAKQTVTLPKLIWKEAFLYGCFCHNCLGFCVFLCPLSTCRSWGGGVRGYVILMVQATNYMYVNYEKNGYFACVTSRDGCLCFLSLRPCHMPRQCHSWVRWGTELALDHAGGPCLESAGTWHSNLRDLML